MEIYNKLNDIGLIPVIKIDDVSKTLPLAKALSDGCLPAMEITFRTACAAEAIKLVADNMPNIVLGAGTVLNVEQVKAAIDAGSQFIVSPGINPKVVEYCVSNNITVIPGCATPTEIELAMSFGLKIVKFFPAESFGGLKTLKAISAPYGDIKFMPTGGITLENMESYLSFSKIIACGGSFMATSELLETNNYEQVTALSSKAAAIVKKLKI